MILIGTRMDELLVGWLFQHEIIIVLYNVSLKDLQYAMRRAGQNPTESETQDMVNKIDDGSSSLNFEVKI